MNKLSIYFLSSLLVTTTLYGWQNDDDRAVCPERDVSYHTPTDNRYDNDDYDDLYSEYQDGDASQQNYRDYVEYDSEQIAHDKDVSEREYPPRYRYVPKQVCYETDIEEPPRSASRSRYVNYDSSRRGEDADGSLSIYGLNEKDERALAQEENSIDKSLGAYVDIYSDEDTQPEDLRNVDYGREPITRVRYIVKEPQTEIRYRDQKEEPLNIQNYALQHDKTYRKVQKQTTQKHISAEDLFKTKDSYYKKSKDRKHFTTSNRYRDSDKDGVVDYQDRCSNTPLGAQVDAVGCEVNKVIHKILSLKFIGRTNRISYKTFKSIKLFSAFMKQHPKYKARIIGYTDSRGGATSNVELSKKRADALKEALIIEGIDASRMSTVGRGESNPLYSNKTKKGREANNRIEVDLYK